MKLVILIISVTCVAVVIATQRRQQKTKESMQQKRLLAQMQDRIINQRDVYRSRRRIENMKNRKSRIPDGINIALPIFRK
jgi:type II secretory pathway pseudopilin PulG